MSRDLKIALGVFLLSLVSFLLVAVIAGPNVDVNSTVSERNTGVGRYQLQVDTDEVAGTTHFTVTDTEAGATYVFDQNQALSTE